MGSIADDLVEAFHADHRDLGQRLHDLGLRLRARDLVGARESAAEIDRVAGAHIAFEESDFYPMLRQDFGDSEVDRLFREHQLGLRVVRQLANTPPDAALSDETWAALLADTEAMETHIAECGSLFASIASLSQDQQLALLARLKLWRQLKPRWREVTTDRKSGPTQLSGQHHSAD